MAKNETEGSFVRWQAITIAQLTYAVNLVLGLSVAALGFVVTLCLNGKFDAISCWQCWLFYFVLLSLGLLAASVGFGVATVINRLRDFRATMKAARLHETGADDQEIKPYRTLYRKLGDATWTLFWWQIGTFTAGIILTSLCVLVSILQGIV